MNKPTTTFEAFEMLNEAWSNVELLHLEELLENNERLMSNIIQAAKKYNVINEVHDYLLDQVDKPLDKGGIDRDTFQYFVDLMMINTEKN